MQADKNRSRSETDLPFIVGLLRRKRGPAGINAIGFAISGCGLAGDLLSAILATAP